MLIELVQELNQILTEDKANMRGLVTWIKIF